MEEKNHMGWYGSDDSAIDFAVYRKQPGWSRSVPLHCHDYFEIEFVVNGSLTNTVNGQPKRMELGDLFLLSVGDSHRLDIHDGDVLPYKLSFRSDAFPSDMREFIDSSPLPLSSITAARNSTRYSRISKSSSEPIRASDRDSCRASQ